MVSTRRRLLRTVAAGLGTAAVAGCVDSAPPAGRSNETTDPGATPERTETRTTDRRSPTDHSSTDEPPTDETPTEGARPRPTDGDPSETVHPSAEVSYDHRVIVENRTDAERTVRLTVGEPRDGPTDEAAVYHAESYTAGPYTDAEVFDFASLDLTGDRELTVTATHDGTTERVTIRTTVCYGDVLVSFSSEDGFVLTYSVC